MTTTKKNETKATTITRLSKINLGIFKDDQSDKNKTSENKTEKPKDFGRFNLVYGANGSGKTTLARVFRELMDDEQGNQNDDRTSGSEFDFSDGSKGLTAKQFHESVKNNLNFKNLRVFVYRRDKVLTVTEKGGLFLGLSPEAARLRTSLIAYYKRKEHAKFSGYLADDCDSIIRDINYTLNEIDRIKKTLNGDCSYKETISELKRLVLGYKSDPIFFEPIREIVKYPKIGKQCIDRKILEQVERNERTEVDYLKELEEVTFEGENSFSKQELDKKKKSILAIFNKLLELRSPIRQILETCKDELSVAVEMYKANIKQYEKDFEEQKTKFKKLTSDEKQESRINIDLKDWLSHDELSLKFSEEYREKDFHKLLTEGSWRVYRKNSDNEPAKNISDGEKGMIALVYFINTLKHEYNDDFKDLIIVLDDPVVAMDATNVAFASVYLREKLESVRQLFILTHDYNFFHELKYMFDRDIGGDLEKDEYKAYLYMTKCHDVKEDSINNKSSKLENLDPFLQNYPSELLYMFSKIYRCVNQDNYENYYGMYNVARRFCELFQKIYFPADTQKNLWQLQDGKGSTTNIYNFIRRSNNKYSHAEVETNNFAADLENTKKVMKRVLKRVENLDKGLYERLVDKVDPGKKKTKIVRV